MIEIHVDGASKGNNAKMAIRTAYTCVVVPDYNKISIKEKGNLTNNEAEWDALIDALMIAQKLEIDSLKIISDSQLVVNQFNDIYRIKKLVFQNKYDFAKGFINLNDLDVRVVWRPRDENYAGQELERRYG